MGFRLVPKPVTLNDLERRNDRYLAFFRRIWQLWALITSKWLKIDLYSLRRKCTPKNLVFSEISFVAIVPEVTENERIIDRHLRDIHPLLDYDASESQVEIGLSALYGFSVRPCSSRTVSQGQLIELLVTCWYQRPQAYVSLSLAVSTVIPADDGIVQGTNHNLVAQSFIRLFSIIN